MDFYSQKNNLDKRKVVSTGQDIPNLKGLKKNGFKKYEDPTGMFSNRQLKFSAWYVENRILLYRILVGFLIVFSTVTILYSLLRVAWILIVDVPRDNKMMEELARFDNYERLHPIFAPQSLLMDENQIFVSGVGKYDAMVQIINPNTKHIAYFDYYFSFNDTVSEKKKGFLLPQETKLFAEFGLGDNYGSGLILENISFKRINAHLFPDPISYIAQRNLFSIENLEFKGVLHPEGANANIIKFDLVNNSPFHYWSPVFLVEFRNGGATVGVAELHLERFESLQRRSVDLRSFVDNLFVDEVVVYPSINYFERSVYFEPIR